MSAALCELAYWTCQDRTAQDSLLKEKAAFLETAGEFARAYETLCRIPSFGLDESARDELLRRKLQLSYEAGDIESFESLLDEASQTGVIDTENIFSSGKTHKKSEDAAMLLSILPGAGLAYAGQWPAAGKYFLLQSSILALGTGCFVSGLYAAAFIGGGILLYETLPISTELAIRAASSYNATLKKQYYAPVYEAVKQFQKNQGTPEP